QNSDKAAAMELFALVDAYHDCWAGQTLVFDTTDESGPRTPQIVAPDLTVRDIALNGSEEAALRMFLNQIEHHDILARKHDIPFKRGVLLYGPWGTGKTLAAAVAMASCRRAGITVIQERNWASLESTMQLARTMQPCMVFCEDIDLVTNRSLTNILDDATLKDCAVSLVVTTNNPEKLDPALTRTGRLDIAIGFALPDRITRERILAINNAPFYNDDIAEATIDFTGSDLAEVAKRATINAVAAQRPMQADDVLGGAYSLKRPPAYVAPDTLADALGQVAEALGIKNLQDTVDDIESTVDQLG
ncbi:MAG: AAA family ATPase, partial [Ilumatobacteraceae bacterium]